MPLINFSGIASGIDSAALIEALLGQQRQARIEPLEQQISQLEDTNSALDELKSLVRQLHSSVSGFRSLNGGPIAKQAGSSNAGVVEAVAGSAATPGAYNVTVNQLASNATFSFDDRFASATSLIDASINDAAPASDRTVRFTIGTGGSAETIDIELTSSSTLSDFVRDFNSQSQKATASLVNTGTSAAPSYAIVLNSNEQGVSNGTITLDSVGAGISSFGSNTLEQAKDAQFTIDGLNGTITRSSNTINDALPGVTLNLKATGSTTVTVRVDQEITKSSIRDFVDSYNEIVNFIRENDLIERNERNGSVEMIFGPLASSSLDENLLAAIRSAFSSSAIQDGDGISILADLGITTERDGTLKFDDDVFNEALGRAPGDVRRILENLGESLASVNGTLDQFTRFQGLIDNSSDLNVSKISTLQDRIGRTEDSLARQEESLLQRFSRLEALIGQLQSQQSSLTGILAGIG